MRTHTNIDDISIKYVQFNENLQDAGSDALQQIRQFEWGPCPGFIANMSQEYTQKPKKAQFDAASVKSKVVCAQSLHFCVRLCVCVFELRCWEILWSNNSHIFWELSPELFLKMLTFFHHSNMRAS